MNLRLPHAPEIALCSNRFEEPISIAVDAFVDFSFWMSEELLELENRFADSRVPAKNQKVKH
jgi:hypothetical protein